MSRMELPALYGSVVLQSIIKINQPWKVGHIKITRPFNIGQMDSATGNLHAKYNVCTILHCQDKESQTLVRANT